MPIFRKKLTKNVNKDLKRDWARIWRKKRTIPLNDIQTQPDAVCPVILDLKDWGGQNFDYSFILAIKLNIILATNLLN